MKKLTLLFFALFIVFLLSACADITTLTIDSNNTQSRDTLINLNDVENTTITSNDSNSIISELESLVNELKNQVSELKSQNDSLTSQIESLSNELDELKEENKTHNSEILELNNEISELTSRMTELQGELDNLNNQLSELKEENTTHDSEILELNNEISELTSRMTELEGELDNLNNQLSELKEENTTHDSKILELNNEIEKINSEKEILQNRISYLEDEIKVGLTSNYNKVGKFYEKEVDGMVDYYNYNKSHEVAGMYFYLNYPDKDIVFRVHSDSSDFISPPNGSGERASNYIEITPDPNGFLFYVDEDTSKLEDAVVSWCWAMNTIPKDYYFMDVIIMKDDNILGFVVLKMIDRLVELPVGLYNATTLKSVVLPKIGDEYQNVTLEQVNLAINEVILLNTPVEEE